ncbi:MAG: glycosyltransferase family 2 protein [Acidobacteria bacterium]|nr:glycosyltransferase family 2 protein [Acidobacteriota bacterium]
MPPPVTVVIPCYNERTGISAVVVGVREALDAAALPHEILVVDDGSADGSADEARAAGARVVRHRSNRGYGAALKTGISLAAHERIVILDADGTYPPRYIPVLLEMLESSDMVVGARTGDRVHIPLVRRPAKWLLNRLANYTSSSSIPDLNSGLRAFRREVVSQYFGILPDQFSFTTTITMAMHCDKYAVSYLPIDYLPREGRSKIVPWDAASFMVLILRTAMLFRPLRLFLPIVLLCLVYGIVKMSIDFTHQPNISASALLAFGSALQLLLIGMVGDALATRLGKMGQSTPGVVRGDEISEHEDR